MKTTVDIIEEIISHNNNISSIRVVSHDIQKDTKIDLKSVWTGREENVYNNALQLKANYSIPFWNGIMLSNINNPQWSESCLSASFRHNPVHFVADVPVNRIETLKTITVEGDRKSINSHVMTTEGKVKHIPMLDFHIPVNTVNTGIVKYICKIIGQDGYILNSGRSYHFIGKTLFSHENMIKFLGQALLFTPIVDEIWIAHQLQDGSCSLRFGEKNGVYPTLICEI